MISPNMRCVEAPGNCPDGRDHHTPDDSEIAEEQIYGTRSTKSTLLADDDAGENTIIPPLSAEATCRTWLVTTMFKGDSLTLWRCGET